MAASARGVGALVRELLVGIVGTVVLAVLLLTNFGVEGVGAAVLVGIVFVLLGGPFGYAAGQVLVASTLAVPLNSAAFLPVQAALLLVCFGRVLGSARWVPMGAAVVGSTVVASALLVTSLGTATVLWETSAVLLVAATVTIALFWWYEPSDRTVEEPV